MDVCHHRSLDRPVILKMSVTEGDRGEAINARFQREARALSEISHPNVVRLLDSGRHLEYRFLLFELVEGEVLAEFIARRGRIPWWEALELTRSLGEGLAEIHALGLMHRDIKPHNIILDPTRGPVLIDFGLVKSLEGQTMLTTPFMVVGTPMYMAPEMIMGQEMTPAADVYSVGILLHELIAGTPPFQRDLITEILEAQVNASPPPIPGLPGPVAQLLARCLSKAPADRPANGRAYVEAVQAILQETDETELAPGAQMESGTEPIPIGASRAAPTKELPAPAGTAAKVSDRTTAELGAVREGGQRRRVTALVAVPLLAIAFLAGYLASRDAPGPGASPGASATSVRADATAELLAGLADLSTRKRFRKVASCFLGASTPSADDRDYLSEVTRFFATHDQAMRDAFLDGPYPARWELHLALAPFEGLERLMPDTYREFAFPATALRRLFVVTKVKALDAHLTPTGEDELIVQFDHRKNTLLVHGLDEKDLARTMRAFLGETKQIVQSLSFNLPWKDGEGSRMIRLTTICLGRGSSLELHLGEGRILRIWGEGATADIGAFHDVSGLLSGARPLVLPQMVEFQLPVAALAPGSHRVIINSRGIVPPDLKSMDCVPSVDWIAFLRAP